MILHVWRKPEGTISALGGLALGISLKTKSSLNLKGEFATR